MSHLTWWLWFFQRKFQFPKNLKTASCEYYIIDNSCDLVDVYSVYAVYSAYSIPAPDSACLINLHFVSSWHFLFGNVVAMKNLKSEILIDLKSRCLLMVASGWRLGLKETLYITIGSDLNMVYWTLKYQI